MTKIVISLMAALASVIFVAPLLHAQRASLT
jgi:hypothetical protein